MDNDRPADADGMLVARARAAARAAYAPYSRFSVGCAIEGPDGAIVTGANMENACYRLGTCAEIAALTAANQAFGLAGIVRIAVAGGHLGGDGALTGETVVTPCGGCRQAILEAAQRGARDIAVICASGSGETVEVRAISALLPAGFGPENLRDAG